MKLLDNHFVSTTKLSAKPDVVGLTERTNQMGLTKSITLTRSIQQTSLIVLMSLIALAPVQTIWAQAKKNSEQQTPSKVNSASGSSQASGTEHVTDAEREILKLKSDIEKLYQGIADLNKNLSCQLDRDCVALPMGARPCGGPEKYLVSSAKNRNFKEIQKKAQQSIELEKKFNLAAGIGSICSVAIQPDVKCVNRLCRVVKAPLPVEGDYSKPQ